MCSSLNQVFFTTPSLQVGRHSLKFQSVQKSRGRSVHAYFMEGMAIILEGVGGNVPNEAYWRIGELGVYANVLRHRPLHTL
jgi:hypothetical protein